MSLSQDQIRRIAQLAHLAVRGEDAEPVRERLNRVLELIDLLQAVDTAGIEPMSHALDIVQPLREDAIVDCEQRERFQAVAPAVAEGLYLVPKVIE